MRPGRSVLILFLALLIVLGALLILAKGQSLSIRAANIPSGVIVLVNSGTCPATFTEVSNLDGFMLLGTLGSHGDVGITGGSDNITPAGTVAAPTLTMASYTPGGTVAAPTFTGTSAQATSAVSAGTPAGTNGTAAFTPAGTVAWPVGVPTFAGNAGTVPAQTFTGSALATHAHELPSQSVSGTVQRFLASTIFGTGTSRAAASTVTTTANTTAAAVDLSQAVSAGTPAGTNGTAAFTPAGTVAWPAGVPAFSGSGGTVPAQTFTGSALGTHSHTLTPAGTNSAPAFTGNAAVLTGSNSAPGFTGTSFDNRSLYRKVIFCSKD